MGADRVLNALLYNVTCVPNTCCTTTVVYSVQPHLGDSPCFTLSFRRPCLPLCCSSIRECEVHAFVRCTVGACILHLNYWRVPCATLCALGASLPLLCRGTVVALPGSVLHAHTWTGDCLMDCQCIKHAMPMPCHARSPVVVVAASSHDRSTDLTQAIHWTSQCVTLATSPR